jgi:hypothetical protein
VGAKNKKGSVAAFFVKKSTVIGNLHAVFLFKFLNTASRV